nr:DapH/DapD/GlmU-related protein [Natrialba swarupiae]
MTMYEIAEHDGFQSKPLTEEPTIHPSATVRESRLGAWTQIGEHVRMRESTFDDYSYIVRQGSVANATVGKFCSIASFVRLNPGNHPTDRPTQHHLTYRRRQYDLDDADEEAFFEWRRDQPVTVEHDVWIGHGATVMPDVEIGTGAVVGAGAVVTRDVEPYSMVAGVPAEPIGRRFDRETADRIEATEWWHWSRSELEEAFEALTDLETFLAEYA